MGNIDGVMEELLTVEAELQDVQDQIRVLLDQQEGLQQRQSELRSLLETYEKSESVDVAGPSTAEENWGGKFDWDSEADDIRFNVFGIPSYRANQREIVNAVMSGRDVLVIMAAGGGKSLCYQLPALLRNGIALVVSPLLSLIQDQVMGLTALGIPAHMLTSTTNKEDEKSIYKTLEKGEGQLKVLYVTPEKISKSKRFMSKLEKCHHAGRLSLIAIDEAHCCSQWGHDFRPDYKNLSILKTQFPTVPVIALTATATRKVQIDLMEMLHIPKCVKFVSTVNRPNLFYMVREKSSVAKNLVEDIAEFIKGSYPKSESGIVYCFSRKECEQVAKELQQRGIKADHYHADMDVRVRENVHMRWSNGALQVIVGTVAFGMGINKPDVRFVIHHSLSKSMETYYQKVDIPHDLSSASLEPGVSSATTSLSLKTRESGRAGRDGLPAECLLYYRPADMPRQSSMVFYENSGLQNLYDIVRYCQSRRACRRAAFFRHFAEPLQDCNGMCDNCAIANETKDVDVSGFVKAIISLLQDVLENDQRMTLLQLVDKMKNKPKELGLDLKKDDIEQLIVQLLLDRVLKEEFQHTAYATNAYVTLGPLARQVLHGKKTITLEILSSVDGVSKLKSSKRKPSSSGLELKLDELRKELASVDGGIFPHSVLSTQQITMLATQKPDSIEQLEKVIGKLKTKKYGERILQEIASSDGSEALDCERSPEKSVEKRASKKMKAARKEEDEEDLVHIDSSEGEA